MQLVPDRGKFDREMRIVRKNRTPALRLPSRNDPIVGIAAFDSWTKPFESWRPGGLDPSGLGGARFARRARRFASRRARAFSSRREGCSTSQDRRPLRRITPSQLPRGRLSQLRGESSPDQLRLVILGQAPGEQAADGERILGRPRRWGDPQDLHLDRAAAAGQGRGHGVDAGRVTLKGTTHSGGCARPFTGGGLPKTKRQEPPVDRQGRFTHDFRQAALRDTPVQLHLPQAVARMQRPRRKPRIVGVTGIGCGHAVAVNQDLDRGIQTRQGLLTVQSRQGAARPPPTGGNGGDK